MRVFGRVLVLAVALCAFAPAVASATPLLGGDEGDPCTGIVADASLAHCGLFDLESFDQALTVSLSAFDEVVLIRFSLSDPSSFDASSIEGFGGFLGLFDGETFDSVSYDAEGVPTKAQGFELGTPESPILLDEGVYILAVISGFNTFTSSETGSGAPVESLLLGFSCDGRDSENENLSICGLGDGGAFTLQLSAVSEGGEPVPEPGTLMLLGGGVLAAVIRGRTRKRI
jgi:hypothetical protein